MPKNHLYTLAVQIRVLNNAKDLLKSDGTPYLGVTLNDIGANISEKIIINVIFFMDMGLDIFYELHLFV